MIKTGSSPWNKGGGSCAGGYCGGGGGGYRDTKKYNYNKGGVIESGIMYAGGTKI